MGPEMDTTLNKMDEQVTDIVTDRERAALEGLPIFLRKNSACFLKICLDTDPEDHSTRD